MHTVVLASLLSDLNLGSEIIEGDGTRLMARHTLVPQQATRDVSASSSLEISRIREGEGLRVMVIGPGP